jgi:hypothetical protein
VDDAEPVRGVQATRHLLDDLDSLPRGHGAALCERLAKRLAFQIFHRNVGSTVIGLARFVNRHDIGVMDSAG